MLSATTPSTFNADFYTVLATVIPVALLALSIVGFRAYGFQTLVRWLTRPGRLEDTRISLALLIGVTPFVFGWLAEGACLNALHDRQNIGDGSDGFIVFIFLTLLGIAIAGPMFDVAEKLIFADHVPVEKRRRVTEYDIARAYLLAKDPDELKLTDYQQLWNKFRDGPGKGTQDGALGQLLYMLERLNAQAQS
jgi:hypothetical protein